MTLDPRALAIRGQGYGPLAEATDGFFLARLEAWLAGDSFVVHRAALATAERLHALGYPLSVRYHGSPIGPRGAGSSVAYFAADTGGTPRGMAQGVGTHLPLVDAGVCIVSCESSLPGAARADHQALTMRNTRAVAAALVRYTVGSQLPFPTFDEARFLDDVERSDLLGPLAAGAAFVLRFGLSSALADTDFDGASDPLGSPIARVADPTIELQ